LDDVSTFPSQGLQSIIAATLYIVSHPLQEGVSMDFYAVLDQVLDLLRQRGRVTYNALKRQFGLDDACLQDLKDEIIVAQRVAVDEDDKILVWAGDVVVPPPPAADVALVRTNAPVTAPLVYTPPHLTDKIFAARPSLEGERKQVTVFFADIKDSTRLIEGLDPEAAQQLLDPALRLMMEAVHRFEGTVNQVLGDGIMALFGAPIAHEDHALRACYAALALQSAIRPYADEVRRAQGMVLQLRVGLNSGEVVVRAIGNDLHMDYSAVGQNTHLAARMEQLATPGTILLTAATWRLVEGLVRVKALGAVPVKGLTAPVEAFELVGVTALRRRLQAAAARGLTRFVRRQHELDALHLALAQAAAGHGQMVALVGEAGVGKSRLVYEFVHAHPAQGWFVLESASVSYGKATPYFPVLDLLKRYCHLEEQDDPRTVRAKVTGQVLTLDESLQDTLPALLSLLEVLPEDSPFRTLDPPQRRQHTLQALKRVLLRESQVQPLLLVFEDLHWIDAETQALLNSLVESLPTAQLLLLVNYRPEYQHGWGSKTYYTQLRLDPLPPASAEEFLAALLGDDPSLAPLKQLLIARTGGNPFFLEESVRTLVETGVLVGAPEAYRLAQALPTIQVPATVQAVLAARIDRLPPEEKRLLQTAAVIGTEVPLPLLQAIAELPETALYRGLAHLQAAEFLYETRLFPEPEYTFKHALTHEVAYGSLLLERRRMLHARIVETLEALAPERVAEQVERLAHHAFRGAMWDKALAYMRQAGAKAAMRSAYREAVTWFEQALRALKQLPESPSMLEQGFDLRMELRPWLVPLAEYARILDHLHEAEAIATAQGDRRRLGLVYSHLTDYYRLTGNSEQAVIYGERALTFAAELRDFSLQVLAYQRLGHACHAVGAYRRSIQLLKQNVAALTGELLRERFSIGSLPAAHSRSYMVMPLVELGEFTEAVAIGEEAVRIADAADTAHSQVLARHAVGLAYLYKGDFDRALPLLERALRRSQVEDMPLNIRVLASTLGYAYALSGRVADGVSLLEQAVQQTKALHIFFRYALWLAWLGEAYLLAGRRDQAFAFAERAVKHASAYKEPGHRGYALRLLGETAAHQDPPEIEPAEAHYQQALALAEALGMRPLVARCHLGLGRLYGQTGRGEQARAALTTAIDLYRAMDMTFWLPQAEAALAQMA
jgi:class 3 adenylate cyclase/tetratricopeptide (TPR) repeat protein